jgi:hypothetical protein
MNEPKNSANSEPPDADEDDDDAATKLSELPSDLMFDDGNAPFEPAAEDVEMVAPTPPPPRPASAPESVQIRALGPPALSGDDIDVHGDTRLIQVPNDPANAVANAANAANAGQGNPQATTQATNQNEQSAQNAPQTPPPFGVYPPQQQPPQQQQPYAPQQQQPQQQQPQQANPAGQQAYQPQQQGQSGQHAYEPASPFAATAYANPTNAPNTQQLQGAGSQPQQRALGYAPTAPSPFVVGPPAPVAVQAKFAPPYASPSSGGAPASGIVWAIGGILVGLVLLGIIAFVLFWLLRSN